MLGIYAALAVHSLSVFLATNDAIIVMANAYFTQPGNKNKHYAEGGCRALLQCFNHDYRVDIYWHGSCLEVTRALYNGVILMSLVKYPGREYNSQREGEGDVPAMGCLNHWPRACVKFTPSARSWHLLMASG